MEWWSFVIWSSEGYVLGVFGLFVLGLVWGEEVWFFWVLCLVCLWGVWFVGGGLNYGT